MTLLSKLALIKKGLRPASRVDRTRHRPAPRLFPDHLAAH